MTKILLVEDDVAFCTMLKTFLVKKECDVDAVYTATEALNLIAKNKYDVVISDVRLPDKEGLEILQAVNQKAEKTGVIMMTSYAEISMAVNAIKEGALDYIAKPFHPEVILKAINDALENPVSSNTPPPKKKPTSPSRDTYIKGGSEASSKLNNYIELVAPTNMSVLIMGESGTGKEQIAKSIHQKSKRSTAAFVAVDCGAIPRELASSEFFGHVKGSFTGAVNNKTGHFEAANGGTLFLDEIGNLNYELQVQLLRALQERKIKPVGSNEEIRVDIRVVAATNEDLFEAVKKGDFREDLYHRLNEFSIKVPALKERKEDLMIFANYFLDSANEELEKDISGFSEKTVIAFKNYNWPGNLRELKNVVKRAVLLSEGEYISSSCLPSEVLQAKDKPKEEQDYSLFKNRNEQEMILEALEKTHGNKSKAAKLLSIDRKTLYNKLKQYGINL
ncbi:sigma-54-dependent transcriptional regulator [Salinimicrobium sp. HB62]|uniref:sigma-54-dependent transcriptional regulator n=1 Tax=Salinimicrobium sp. HB62 TaxID=3077781 RepID=UPI002D78D6A9|nr:sigma-54 dependent transcriptional regulator [Salinimicrobium sp. HB62]